MNTRLLTNLAAIAVLCVLNMTFYSSIAYSQPTPLSRCNDDRDCDGSPPGTPTFRCNDGRCVIGRNATIACNIDAHCLSGSICVGSSCRAGACRTDGNCSSGSFCFSRNCEPAECRRDQNCKQGERCNNKQCEKIVVKKRCPAKQKWVKSNGIPTCGACVAETRPLPKGTRCSLGKVFAQGYCIPSCTKTKR